MRRDARRAPALVAVGLAACVAGAAGMGLSRSPRACWAVVGSCVNPDFDMSECRQIQYTKGRTHTSGWDVCLGTGGITAEVCSDNGNEENNVKTEEVRIPGFRGRTTVACVQGRERLVLTNGDLKYFVTYVSGNFTSRFDGCPQPACRAPPSLTLGHGIEGHWHGMDIGAGPLCESQFQVAIAMCALLLGVACAGGGAWWWRTTFTAATAILAFGAALGWAQARGAAAPWQLFLSALAAVAAALASAFGFEVMQVLFGAVLGLGGAHGCLWWVHTEDHTTPSLMILCILYALCAAAGALAYTVFRARILPALLPLLGGFLASSGAGLLVCRALGVLAIRGARQQHPPVFARAPWSAFATGLLGAAGPGSITALEVFAAVAATLLGCSPLNRGLAVGCLLSWIGITAVLAGAGAEGSPGGFSPCRSLPDLSDQWQWTLSGCILWAAITAASALLQPLPPPDWDRGSGVQYNQVPQLAHGPVYPHAPFGKLHPNSRIFVQ